MLGALDPPFHLFRSGRIRFVQNRTAFGILWYRATIGDLRQGDDVNTYIRATFDGSPAARAGFRFGDRIVAVDGSQ